jgi:DNA-binding SARP family transcriptional activator
VSVALPSQRLLALLGLSPDRSVRSYVAGTLWPESTEAAARSNLRSALWKLGLLRPLLVQVTPQDLQLRPEVEVDVQRSRAVARALDGGWHVDGARLSPSFFGLFGHDLLPDWSDHWLEPERESYRQVRLHALETMVQRLARAERFGEAVQAGLLAISAAPLRESAYKALIEALAAEGNRGEAISHYQLLSDLLNQELGVEPSFRLEDVFTGFVVDSTE